MSNSKYRELDLLKEQERTLMQLHMNFCDQLNRLKVEELALTNLLRLQKEREMHTEIGTSDKDAQVGAAEAAIEQETMEVLNLVVSENPVQKQEEEEENEYEEGEEEIGEQEEEGEDGGDEENFGNSYNDQLTTFLQDLLIQQQGQNQQAADIKEDLTEDEKETKLT